MSKYKFQKNAGIKAELKPLNDTEILSQLKLLWRKREAKDKEKTEHYNSFKRLLGESQEIQRQINEILKMNAE